MTKIIIVSGPVIVENNKVLLDISSGDNFWKFCGGKIKDEEDLVMAAKRRVKEELNIEINIINKEPFLLCVKKPGDENVDVILVHFLAERIGEIKPGEDIREWGWIDMNSLPENLGPNILPALKHFGFIK
ncbi:MAG: NUDIX hydrolase [Patescibacteria group bacterium]|nr:NUDIX hydrolase [Patescibacteria group bacterium]MDD4610596.1 NUDIX hydrolase [Patescibacteria group bacterium]